MEVFSYHQGQGGPSRSWGGGREASGCLVPPQRPQVRCKAGAQPSPLPPAGLKKWVEVGNSGLFRPEMLLPMGLPENVSVIAWGLSLER